MIGILNIKEQNFVELALREKEWLLTIESNKISADEFYISHRSSCLGEISYRDYMLEKLDHIRKYTSGQNMDSAFRSIVMGKKVEYEVPIEFTRFLMKSINERFKKASEMINLYK